MDDVGESRRLLLRHQNELTQRGGKWNIAITIINLSSMTIPTWCSPSASFRPRRVEGWVHVYAHQLSRSPHTYLATGRPKQAPSGSTWTFLHRNI